MTIKIYKGTQNIGGTCVEVKANNGKVLWIDIGMPLEKDSDINYIKKHSADAVLISHPHKDHYGLLENINKDILVYVGNVTLNLINVTNIFLDKKKYENNFEFFDAWKKFTILDTFHIYPYLVDHSSPEAFAFTIECDNKKIFYSGDFRNTGAKKKVFENLCKNPPKNIDLMLVEGTNIERDKTAYPDEKFVESALVNIFKNQKNSSFVIGAG